jgi:hypothetical protein
MVALKYRGHLQLVLVDSISPVLLPLRRVAREQHTGGQQARIVKMRSVHYPEHLQADRHT